MRAVIGACILVALPHLANAAQNQPDLMPQAPSPTLRIGVSMVQMDAVATNSQGERVVDLRREDFEILQDEQPRSLTYFSYVPGPASTAALAPDPKIHLPIPAPAPVTPGQIRRTVALVVDDLALSFDDLVRTRTALREFIELQMQPGDLVALVRTGGGLAILEQFTTDRRLLLEAVDTLKWQYHGRTGLLAIQPERSDGHPEQIGSHPQVLRMGVSLAALGALGRWNRCFKA